MPHATAVRRFRMTPAATADVRRFEVSCTTTPSASARTLECLYLLLVLTLEGLHLLRMLTL